MAANLGFGEIAIGIDLGMNYCRVAAYQIGRVEVIENASGNKATPCYVQYGGDGVIVVGDLAKDRAWMNNTFYDMKKIIGRRFDDEQLQRDMHLWPFGVVEDQGVPKIQIDGGRLLYPEQVSAEILKEMKRISERFLNTQVNKAVITVPAYFTDMQKQATVAAGQLAGLEILSILSEPVAAAINYFSGRDGPYEGEKFIVVFDLAKETFDVAVLKWTNGEMDVLGVGGSIDLGGGDLDKLLVEFCAEEFMKRHGINLFDGKDSTDLLTKCQVQRRLERLENACERVKIQLTSSTIADVLVEGIHLGIDLNVVISRERLEQLCTPKLEECIEILGNTLQDAGVDPASIEDVVLVGGSTKIPKMKELITSFFGGRAFDYSNNPDEAVVQGAAIKAAQRIGLIAEQ